MIIACIKSKAHQLLGHCQRYYSKLSRIELYSFVIVAVS